MIRTPPHHNTKNPPGQIVNPINQGMPLIFEIDEYKTNKDKMDIHKEQYRKLVEESLGIKNE